MDSQPGYGDALACTGMQVKWLGTANDKNDGAASERRGTHALAQLRP